MGGRHDLFLTENLSRRVMTPFAAVICSCILLQLVQELSTLTFASGANAAEAQVLITARSPFAQQVNRDVDQAYGSS